MLERMWFPHDISTFGPGIDLLGKLHFWITFVACKRLEPHAAAAR